MAHSTGRARFANKTVVVTGGAGGIGAAAVNAFHAEGARVAILDLAESGAALASELNAIAKDTARFIKLDVSSEEQVAGAFADIIGSAQFGRTVDVLVNMAAVFTFKEVQDATDAEWNRILGVNIKGAAFCCKAVLPTMRAQRSGAIVFVSSITGNIAFPAFVPYSCTKAALQQMTRDVALDNGKFGIRVNCCAPGPIFTDGGTVAHAHREGVSVDAICAELASEVSLRRMGSVDECAKAVLFLASDDASYVTGTTLHVDGGFVRK